MKTPVGTNGLTVDGEPGDNVRLERAVDGSIIVVERADLANLITALLERVGPTEREALLFTADLYRRAEERYQARGTETSQSQHPTEDGPYRP